jgi:hypothetical protein
MFVTATVLAAAFTFVDGCEPLAPVPVRLHVVAELSDQAREVFFEEVEEIYKPAGISFDWTSESSDAGVRVVIAPRPPYKVITGCSRGLHDHRLGLADPRNRSIILWTEQVARGAAGDWDSRDPPTVSDVTLGRALGRVLAHEMGHLLLRFYDHRSTGLMRKAFKYRDLSSRGRRALRLSSDDIEGLQAGARRLLEIQSESSN